MGVHEIVAAFFISHLCIYSESSADGMSVPERLRKADMERLRETFALNRPNVHISMQPGAGYTVRLDHDLIVGLVWFSHDAVPLLGENSTEFQGCSLAPSRATALFAFDDAGGGGGFFSVISLDSRVTAASQGSSHIDRCPPKLEGKRGAFTRNPCKSAVTSRPKLLPLLTALPGHPIVMDDAH
jgi:hypothetical protein